MKYVLGVLIAGAALVITVGSDAGEKKDPKYTIKEVMREAHKGGLMKKVATGKASEEEKKQLVEFYIALGANKPPMGNEAEWKDQTQKMLKAAKAAGEGDDKAAMSLLKLVNCGACHKKFK
jgi:hypothetical protein